MRIFVSEYLTCGAWPGELGDISLALEGRAMVEALIADLAGVAGWRVVTTWDSRLGPPRFVGAVECRLVASVEQERDIFRELAAASDATLVVAPEFHGILHGRYRLTREAGGRWIGCSAEAIALCSDKLRLAERLQLAGVRAIPTWPLELDDSGRAELPDGIGDGLPSAAFPLVMKPRDGAGSQLTMLVSDRREFKQACREFAASEFRESAIVQPFVPGRPVSAAALLPLTPHHSATPKILPFAEQHLSDDGRFRYLGGRVRFPAPEPVQVAIECVVHATCQAVPGLAGYVGFDLLLPEDDPRAPILVEINPRLTTSYLGLRRLSHGLAHSIVSLEAAPPVTWTAGEICFRADGEIVQATCQG